MSPFEADQKKKFCYERQKSTDLMSYSPSGAASYFTQNFDENGYVFLIIQACQMQLLRSLKDARNKFLSIIIHCFAV